MAVNVCGASVPEQSAWPARKLMYSQLFIAFMLLLLVSGPNIVWQMSLAGKIRHDDIDKEAIESILENSSVIQELPLLKELNLTKYKEDFLDAGSKLNKDHYTAILVGSSLIMVLLPFVCFCFARGAIQAKSTGRMCCICWIEGCCGWSSFLTWFLPLAIAASVLLHLKSDKTFLDCTKMVPWVQNAVTSGIVQVVEQQQPPRFVNVAALTLTATPTLGGILEEVFVAAGVASHFKSAYLDQVSKLMNIQHVDQLGQAWLVQLKAAHPGALPLIPTNTSVIPAVLPTENVPLLDVTNNFLGYMWNNTAPEQYQFCNAQVTKIYSNVGWLSMVFTGLAFAAGCKVFACCLGSCEAWAARISFGSPMGDEAMVGHAQKVLDYHGSNGSPEAEGLLSTHPGGPPPDGKKGYFEACCANHCGWK